MGLVSWDFMGFHGIYNQRPIWYVPKSWLLLNPMWVVPAKLSIVDSELYRLYMVYFIPIPGVSPHRKAMIPWFPFPAQPRPAAPSETRRPCRARKQPCYRSPSPTSAPGRAWNFAAEARWFFYFTLLNMAIDGWFTLVKMVIFQIVDQRVDLRPVGSHDFMRFYGWFFQTSWISYLIFGGIWKVAIHKHCRETIGNNPRLAPLELGLMVMTINFGLYPVVIKPDILRNLPMFQWGNKK
jgi:hypothetical protein